MITAPMTSPQPRVTSATPDRPEIYRINVAMAKLGVSRTTIYRLVLSGDLVLSKIGKRASGITAESLHAHVERNKTSNQ